MMAEMKFSSMQLYFDPNGITAGIEFSLLSAFILFLVLAAIEMYRGRKK